MELKFILESLLFNSQKPLNAGELRQLLSAAASGSEDDQVKAFKKTPEEEITNTLQTLEAEHNATQRSYRIVCVAGAWQFVSQPEYAPWLRVLLGEKTRPARLSQPALETLTIVAYRQPLTRSEMEQIRGVSVDGVIQTLLDRGLVEAIGRAEVVGRPITYGTTPAFLEYFGLRSLEELPAAEELRRIPVLKPEALVTVDPGLATAPPDQLELAPADTADTSAETAPTEEPSPMEPESEAGAESDRSDESNESDRSDRTNEDNEDAEDEIDKTEKP